MRGRGARAGAALAHRCSDGGIRPYSFALFSASLRYATACLSKSALSLMSASWAAICSNLTAFSRYSASIFMDAVSHRETLIRDVDRVASASSEAGGVRDYPGP